MRQYLLSFLTKVVPCFFYSLIIKEKTLIIFVKPIDLLGFIGLLKFSGFLRFTMLLDLWVVDYPERINRFELNYMLLSIYLNFRIILKTYAVRPNLAWSVSLFYNSAVWLEREAWDLFGVFFKGNMDLRRLLTDYGFKGYPMRKDFPLTGYVEVRYDDLHKCVIVEPVELAQDFRFFSFSSPWENDIGADL